MTLPQRDPAPLPAWRNPSSVAPGTGPSSSPAAGASPASLQLLPKELQWRPPAAAAAAAAGRSTRLTPGSQPAAAWTDELLRRRIELEGHGAPGSSPDSTARGVAARRARAAADSDAQHKRAQLEDARQARVAAERDALARAEALAEREAERLAAAEAELSAAVAATREARAEFERLRRLKIECRQRADAQRTLTVQARMIHRTLQQRHPAGTGEALGTAHPLAVPLAAVSGEPAAAAAAAAVPVTVAGVKPVSATARRGPVASASASASTPSAPAPASASRPAPAAPSPTATAADPSGFAPTVPFEPEARAEPGAPSAPPSRRAEPARRPAPLRVPADSPPILTILPSDPRLREEAANRPRMGTVLVEGQRLTPVDVEVVLMHQAEKPRRFGEIAVSLGLLEISDVVWALRRQRPHPQGEAGGASAPAAEPLVLRDRPDSPAAAVIRDIARQIVARRAGATLRQALSVVGVGLGEGRSTVVANLAMAMAEQGERVLLVDTDFTRSRLKHLLPGLSASQGLSALLAGRTVLGDAIARPVGWSPQPRDLHVLPAGDSLGDPAQLARLPAFAQLLHTLLEQYDQVLLDTAAASQGPGALQLACMTGSALVVARPGYTRTGDLDTLTRSLREGGADVVGVVMNSH